VTFVPNRIVLCIFQMLCIPIYLFPYLLPLLYKKIWNQDVGIKLIGPDALIVACICVIAMAVLCIVSVQYEKELGVDVFKKRKMFEKSETEDEEDSEEVEEEGNTAEKNEMIRRILLGWEKPENKEDKETKEDKENTED